jgi:hypothetical protein
VQADRPQALWLVPLIAGLLPAIAALVAMHLSARLELIPSCNPFIEGCVSISRAARHDLPNHIFRALVLPAAALQGLTWLLCTSWLKTLGANPDRPLAVLPWLGVLAAVFFVLYGTFLGTEGVAYRWMRRYGVMFYFGFTCICMVIAAGHLSRLGESGRIALKGRLDRTLLGLCLLLLAMGLANGFSPFFIADQETNERLGNALEWNGALVFTLFFIAMAWLWHRTRFIARMTSG